MTSDAELTWEDGAPRSGRFGDVYFSAADGLAESRAVFLDGCGLPQAWGGRSRFTVAELGFGTGLNLLALLDLWRRARPPGARLHVFSVEAFPLSRDEAARALAAFPEVADLAAALVAAWPSPRPGIHRVDFPTLDAALDLAVGEAGAMLGEWRGRADAWFLDGFAPSKNPEMWRDELLALVAARSAPGARAATFTVAGAVRRGLQAASFAVEKRPGFGRKRERLEARLPGEAGSPPTPSVAVVGAGVAGASLARACRRLGLAATVVERASPGAGASGNPAALVTPRLDAGGGAVAALHAQAFDRAVRLYADEGWKAVIARGAVQMEATARDRRRFDALGAWTGFAPGTLTRLAPEELAALLDEAGPPGGLLLPGALVVNPELVLRAWLADTPRVVGEAARLERFDGGWRVIGCDEAVLAEADAVCVAAGPHTARLTAAPLRAVRGQASWALRPFTGTAAAWGGYAIPTRNGFLFGATHKRDDWATEPRAEEDIENLEALAEGRPSLAAGLKPDELFARASLRAAAPDHLPLAGKVAGEAGLFLLSGLGGRGFTLAPLLAEQVAAAIAATPEPLPSSLAAIVDPGRF